MFSAILIKCQKNENFGTEKLSADSNFGQKNFGTKKNPKVFVRNVLRFFFYQNFQGSRMSSNTYYCYITFFCLQLTILHYIHYIQ